MVLLFDQHSGNRNIMTHRFHLKHIAIAAGKGDTLDADTTVIDIQSKQITLEKAGQQRTLKFNPTPWIK